MSSSSPLRPGDRLRVMVPRKGKYIRNYDGVFISSDADHRVTLRSQADGRIKCVAPEWVRKI